MKGLRVIGAAITIAAIGLLSGCASERHEITKPTTSRPAMSQQQAAAIADGVVTWDEYEAGFRLYQRCLARKGFTVVDLKITPQEIDFSLPEAAADADTPCYDEFWSDVSWRWDKAHENTSETAKHIAACAKAFGLQPGPTIEDNVALLKSKGIGVEQCTLEKVQEAQ